MNAVFQVCFEESPETRKFSEDLRVSPFVLLVIGADSPKTLGRITACVHLSQHAKQSAREIIHRRASLNTCFHGAQMAPVKHAERATRQTTAQRERRDTPAREQAPAES